jgi:class 3 adenylate cyclase
MQFRIGINLGDMIVEEDDIFGDGVNVAARLRRRYSETYQGNRLAACALA